MPRRNGKPRNGKPRSARRLSGRRRSAKRRNGKLRNGKPRSARRRSGRRRSAKRRKREAAEREAAERAALAEREAEQARLSPPFEPVVPGYRPEAVPSNGSARGHWNLIELQRLVEERGGDFPDRIDEWSSYLFFLRDYAEPDGSVPASFDWLIEDEFAELV